MLRANETKQLRLNGISSALFNYEFTLHVNFPVTVDDLINFGNGVAALLAVVLVYLLTGKIKYQKKFFFSITLFFFLDAVYNSISSFLIRLKGSSQSALVKFAFEPGSAH